MVEDVDVLMGKKRVDTLAEMQVPRIVRIGYRGLVLARLISFGEDLR